eukprot:scaffold22507_cov24-Attheya_sp.AAC.1
MGARHPPPVAAPPPSTGWGAPAAATASTGWTRDARLCPKYEIFGTRLGAGCNGRISLATNA